MIRTFLVICSLLWATDALAQNVYWSGGFTLTSRSGHTIHRYSKGGGEGMIGAEQAAKAQVASSREYIAVLDKFGGNFEPQPAIRTVYVTQPVAVPTYGPPPYVYDPKYYYYGYPPYYPRYYWGAPRNW